MKKTLILFIILLITYSSNATEKDTVKLKNEVAIVITDLLNGAYQFKYEHALNTNFSIGAGVGIKGKEGLIHLSGIDTEKLKTSNLTYSGYKIIPEVRYYLHDYHKHYLKGFYFGAYIKHGRYQSDLRGLYYSDTYDRFNLDVDARFNITSVGLLVGYKLQIKNRLSLDFLIAGPGAASHTYSLKSRTEIPDEFYEDLNEALKKYSLYDLLNSDFDFSENRKRSNYMFPAFRYAMSFGFSF